MSSPKIDVVISGISGKFPGCENLEELEQKLLNGEDMINYNCDKWPTGALGVSDAVGSFKKDIAMDIQFFKISNHFYKIMDPITVQGITGSFEAICDAGINPKDLSGSKTAVIMCSYINELEHTFITSIKNLAIVGQNRAMQANRISFCLDLKGPSYVVDSAYNGSVFALRTAYELISSGQCPSAIVAGVNVLFVPEVSFMIKTIGRLNDDGKTKSFSADADGFTRSEAAVVLFLQRAQDAKRSYGTVRGVYYSENGDRDSSFAEVTPQMYKNVLTEAYSKSQIDPSEVAYIEADGQASKKMDAMELNSVAEVLCKNRKTPLHIGSVKSNLGNTEATSFLVSIVKALIALKTGKIPPNLHYSAPNPDVPALLSGQLKVVTELTPLNGNIVGVSNFNTAGSYGHIILERSQEVNKAEPSSIPWLFVVSGRREDGLEEVITKVEAMPFDEHFVRLTHKVFQNQIKDHTYKGFTLLNCSDKLDKEHQNREIKQYMGEKKPIWFMFSGMGSQWCKMGADLMNLPTFAKTIHKCHEILLPKGVDLLKIITSSDSHMFDSILHSFVGIAAIQIALVDILKELGIEPDGIIGHSVGELGCAYADGCFTAEQTILAAYARGRASIEVDLITGMMAAVGKGYNEMKNELPPTIEVACHNSANSCTLSGPAKEMEEYVASIKERGIFAKLVNVSNIAYHSRYIKPAAPILLKYLKEVIPEPKARSKRWISSSIPESSWNSDLAKFSSAEYHTNNLLSSVLFEETSAHIPEGAIVIEIAPHGLLQSIVKESLKRCINIPMTSRYARDNLIYLLKTIGRFYAEGLPIKIDRLYPEVEFPVAKTTPSLQQLLTWDEKLGTGSYKFSTKSPGSEINIPREDMINYLGYKIGSKQLISSTALLNTAIDLTKVNNNIDQNLIIIRNLKFKEQLVYSRNLKSDIGTLLQRGSGNFEIYIEKKMLITGNISIEDQSTRSKLIELEENHMKPAMLEMNHQEIYNYLKGFSVEIKDSYKLLQKISLNSTDVKAVVAWKGDLTKYIDALLMLVSLHESLLNNEFRMVHSVREIIIDFPQFNDTQHKEILVSYNRYTKQIISEGIIVHQPEASKCKIIPSLPQLMTKICQFLPYYSHINNKYHGNIDDCLNLVFHNALSARNGDSKITIIFENNGTLTKHINDLITNYRNSNDLNIDIVISPSEDKMDDVYFNLKRIDTLLIIGELPFYKIILKCFKTVKAGFILLKNTSSTNIWNPIHPILKLEDKVFTLHKACINEGRCLNYVNMNNNDNWKSELLSLINDAAVTTSGTAENVYLVGNIKSLAEIYQITRSCSELQHSHLLRFIFMDENAPPFSPKHPFYKNQIALDLVINISIKNQWGIFKLLQHSNNKLSSKFQLKEEVKTVYSLSSIKGETVSLNTIGLNLSDAEKYPGAQELSVFDYCGVNKDSKILFGIGTLKNQRLLEDKILSWEKPSSWTDESAVSVPLYYSMAYYILRSLVHSNYKAILVHSGGMLVSQAIINVASAEGMDVFITYQTVQEKNHIRKLFPKVKESNIHHCKYVEVPLLRMTNGWGADIVVDTINDLTILKASLRCVSRHGQLYHLNNDITNNEFSLGMRAFIKDVTLHVTPLKMMATLPASDKEMIHKELYKGIKLGHVKPLKTSVIPVTSLNFEAVDMLKKLNNEESMKLMIKCSNHDIIKDKDKNLFICSDEKKCVIISNEDTFYFELLFWLLNRGAKSIQLLAEDNLVSKRSLSIANNYPTAEVTLHPINIIKYENEVKKLLTGSTEEDVSHIFIIGKDMAKEASMIDSVLRKTKSASCMVCIGSGGESVCETRNQDGLESIAICCRVPIMKPALLFPQLDRFVNTSKNNPVVFVEEMIHSTNLGDDEILERLPQNLEELLKLYEKTEPKACFKTVMQISPSHKFQKDLAPVFVLPGLKPNEMNQLTFKIHNPVYEARLPHNFDNIESIVQDLYQNLKQFNYKIFTLIANDLGNIIGLNLAKQLEKNGKIVVLIMLNSCPDKYQNWASDVLQIGDIKLINKYIHAPFRDLIQLSDWEDRIKIALKNCVKDDNEKDRIGNSLNFLRKCLQVTKNHKLLDGSKYQGKYFVFVPNEQIQNDYDNIRQLCQKKTEIEVINANSQQDMLDNPALSSKINSLIPYEFRTAAKDIDTDLIGLIHVPALVMNTAFLT